MVSDVLIRPWGTGDEAGVRALHDRTPMSPDVPLEHPVPWFGDLDDIARNFRAFFVAGADDGIVGIVGITGPGDDVPPKLGAILPDANRVARLTRMRVAPEWQRQGIGRRLVNTVIDWARERGGTHVILETTPQQPRAIALYASCGFTETAMSTAGPWTLVWMVLDIRNATRDA